MHSCERFTCLSHENKRDWERGWFIKDMRKALSGINVG
jgi:hypothetical protein